MLHIFLVSKFSPKMQLKSAQGCYFNLVQQLSHCSLNWKCRKGIINYFHKCNESWIRITTMLLSKQNYKKNVSIFLAKLNKLFLPDRSCTVYRLRLSVLIFCDRTSGTPRGFPFLKFTIKTSRGVKNNKFLYSQCLAHQICDGGLLDTRALAQ